jgi:CRISPR type I-E-associated protein CasB/Cse2
MKDYDHEARVVQTIAGLFALHSTKSDRDFGVACQQLMDEDERKKLFSKNPEDTKNVGPVARRFQHLLSSEKEEICDRAVRMGLRMKAKEISINYHELYNGLMGWGDKIKNRWAGSFWNVPNLEEAAL